MMRILTILGTRPEAIKLAPVILELNKYPDRIESRVCVTAQHREMLDQILRWFEIIPDFDLNLMQPNHSLAEFASRALTSISKVLREARPDLVLIQGDTTTAMMGALAAFYERIPVGHVEAGLRTQNRYDPFPEEINRRIAALLTTYHFAPTATAAAALYSEQINKEQIYVTGNTGIDALLMTLARPINLELDIMPNGHRLILVTAHRRESFGKPFESLCLALRDTAERNSEINIVYPVHLNPNVRGPVMRILGNHPRIHLLEPLRYEQFAHLMSMSHFIVSDSGGIQEEAPALCKPLLVMRNTTERPEAVACGAAKLVGTDRATIVQEAEQLLHDPESYRSMVIGYSPFGDGQAARRIVNVLLGVPYESFSNN
jgi:UDP-N-acetylglucosamine 2-epimerase (non-hydrolysing)